MEVCVDLVAEYVKTALPGANTRGIGGRLAGTRSIDAKAIQGLALRLGAQQQDVQWGHIEASTRYWRFQTDLAERLNCPHCKADTNNHYMHCILCGTYSGSREPETPHAAGRSDT